MKWVEPDIRDEVVEFVELITRKTSYSQKHLLGLIDIHSSKYYRWIERKGIKNKHNSNIPKNNWPLEQERNAIICYAKDHVEEGYRRLTYMMLDDDIVAVSPSTTYRVMKFAGLLNQ